MSIFDLFGKKEEKIIVNQDNCVFKMKIEIVENLFNPRSTAILGTIQKGSLSIGDKVYLIDKDGNAISSYANNIQTVNKTVDKATAGERIAIYLTDRINKNKILKKNNLAVRITDNTSNQFISSNKSIINNQGIMNIFLRIFSPGNNLVKPDEKLIKQFEHLLPAEIIKLWKDYGFGEYGNGLIRIINPIEFMELLYSWLGKVDYTRVPIMIDAFGDIFYYRDLGNGVNDISVIDVHYGEIKVCTYSYEEFFEAYIIDESKSNIYLRRSLYNDSINKFGKLSDSEIFWFVPAIETLGYEHIDFIVKDKASPCEEYLHAQFSIKKELTKKYKDMNSLMIVSNVFPMENNLIPVIGNVVKGTFNVNDNITIITFDGNSFESKIEKILLGNNEGEESVGVIEKVLFYVIDVSREDIKNNNPIERSVIVKK